MNGARMRSNSLSGTRPSNTSRSVPRLMAPKRARTRNSPAAGAATASSRSSARLFATYQRAFDAMSTPELSTPEFATPEMSTLERHAQIELYPYTLEMKAMLERRSAEALTDAPPTGRRASVLYAGRLVDGGRDLAARLRVVGGRLRPRRPAAGPAVHGDAAVDGDRLLERHHRLHHHALRARSGGGGDAIGRARVRARADRVVDRDPGLHPQRAAGARHPPHCTDDRRSDRARRRATVPPLCAERHLRPRARRHREPAVLRARQCLARPHRADLPPPRTQYRLQGRQHPRLLRALGRAARLRAGARRRQPDDRRGRAAPRAHHAGQSAARHPAKPGRRHAVDQRVRAHLPVRHAARHALLHHRQRLVAGRLRPLLGPQRHPADRAVHDALPPSRSSARARSSTATSSATTRSKRC